MRRSWFAASGLTAGILSEAGLAHAQTLATQADRDQATGADGAAGRVQELVVTGSRLQTTLLNAPAPVIAVTAEQIQQTGTDNLERILTQLPAIGVGLSDTNSENYYAEAGLNLIDLRHLGYNRTLVLVNGRRQVPGDIYTTAVDLNAIPAPLIDRVERIFAHSERLVLPRMTAPAALSRRTAGASSRAMLSIRAREPAVVGVP